MKNNSFIQFFIFLLLFIFFPSAAKAYAGPGVAIGFIIVFFTVIFAFFASSFISIFKFSKKSFSFIKNSLLKKRGSQKKIKNKK